METPKKRPVVANLRYGGKYRKHMERAAVTGECLFCSPRFKAKRLHTEGCWFVKRNDFPTKDVRGRRPEHQLLFVKLKHGDAKPPSFEDLRDIGKLLRWAMSKLKIDGGCLFIRMGNPQRSGMTILHPHAHFLVPRLVKNRKGPGTYRAVPVYVPAG